MCNTPNLCSERTGTALNYMWIYLLSDLQLQHLKDKSYPVSHAPSNTQICYYVVQEQSTFLSSILHTAHKCNINGVTVCPYCTAVVNEEKNLTQQ